MLSMNSATNKYNLRVCFSFLTFEIVEPIFSFWRDFKKQNRMCSCLRRGNGLY